VFEIYFSSQFEGWLIFVFGSRSDYWILRVPVFVLLFESFGGLTGCCGFWIDFFLLRLLPAETVTIIQ